MSTYQIITDSGSDLPERLAAAIHTTVVPLTVQFRGESRPDSTGEELKELYAAWRAGEVSKTSAVNPEQWRAVMEPVLAGGEDLLVIAFSSGLSTTYQSACIAAEDLKEKYPRRTIRVEDSLCASLGQGLLVWYACQKRDEGMGLAELADWVHDHKLHLCHWFTVDDLQYLKRGGRISAATALVGSMLQIKPILHVDDEGHLISVGKARGRKASLDAIVAKVEKLGIPGENDTMFICHGDCRKDAEYVAEQVKQKYGVKTVTIGYTGAVIGSHSGPGTLALFFLGVHR